MVWRPRGGDERLHLPKPKAKGGLSSADSPPRSWIAQRDGRLLLPVLMSVPVLMSLPVLMLIPVLVSVSVLISVPVLMLISILVTALAKHLDREGAKGLARADVIHAERIPDSRLQTVAFGVEIRVVLAIPSRKLEAFRTAAEIETRHFSFGAGDCKIDILPGMNEPGGVPQSELDGQGGSVLDYGPPRIDDRRTP
jgi:hypothetical protein